MAGAPAGSRATCDTAEAETTVRLRVLATTDLHGHLLSYDYLANRPQYGLGLAQAVGLIQRARAEVPGSLLLDNGDFLQGSALAELAATPGRRRPHPAIAAFNTLGYDAAALGNHEFNYGLPLLAEALKAARFPVLSANVLLRRGTAPCEDEHLTSPFALIERELPDESGRTHVLRIGVLGLTPPQIVDWDRRHLQDRIATRPMLDSARAWVPRMRAAGADVVVCLAHTGVGQPGEPSGTECCAGDIAAVEGVDAVVAGHSHLVFPRRSGPDSTGRDGLIGGKPVVQPGHSGSHLGVIDLWLAPRSRGWSVVRSEARALSVSEIAAGLDRDEARRHAAPLRAALGADHRVALARIRQQIGRIDLALTTHFALVADSRASRLVAEAMVEHARDRLAGRAEAELPILASVTPYRTGGRGGPVNFTEIPPGPLSLRNVFDLYPFPNTVVAELTTGVAILARLERAAAIFNRIRPGRADQILIDPTRPGLGFETIPGLNYRIDPSRPSFGELAPPESGLIAPEAALSPGRILGLGFRGLPVAPGDRFVLVTNSHLNAQAPGGPILIDEGVLCTDVLAEFIRRRGAITTLPGPGWSLAPLPGTSVLHDTGPGGLSHGAEAAHLRPEFVGVTPAGFHRFRLHL
ncbi:metallophosphoesterase [Pseudogemmobacter sonorensis]|uniref:metallophosphoesterase n=1 Tax=Pseudogemmobacter sonorensis TaxID=2989681 RepID=UPI0036985010